MNPLLQHLLQDGIETKGWLFLGQKIAGVAENQESLLQIHEAFPQLGR